MARVRSGSGALPRGINNSVKNVVMGTMLVTHMTKWITILFSQHSTYKINIFYLLLQYIWSFLELRPLKASYQAEPGTRHTKGGEGGGKERREGLL